MSRAHARPGMKQRRRLRIDTSTLPEHVFETVVILTAAVPGVLWHGCMVYVEYPDCDAAMRLLAKDYDVPLSCMRIT